MSNYISITIMIMFHPSIIEEGWGRDEIGKFYYGNNYSPKIENQES